MWTSGFTCHHHPSSWSSRVFPPCATPRPSRPTSSSTTASPGPSPTARGTWPADTTVPGSWSSLSTSLGPFSGCRSCTTPCPRGTGSSGATSSRRDGVTSGAGSGRRSATGRTRATRTRGMARARGTERDGGAGTTSRPFAVLCLADFTGRSSGEVVAVDRDDLDGALARWRPEVRLDSPLDIALTVASLEDLHPDRLIEQLEVFKTFHTLRRRLHDPEGFRTAAAEVRRWMATEWTTGSPGEERGAESLSEGQAVVQSLLAGGGRAREPGADEWAAFIRHIVAPHLVTREDPQRPALVAAVDRASEALMRGILHHRSFQAREATWRAVDFLARRLETGPELQIRLLDIARSDLQAALDGRDGARARMLRRALVEDPAVPWAVMVG